MSVCLQMNKNCEIVIMFLCNWSTMLVGVTGLCWCQFVGQTLTCLGSGEILVIPNCFTEPHLHRCELQLLSTAPMFVSDCTTSLLLLAVLVLVSLPGMHSCIIVIKQRASTGQELCSHFYWNCSFCGCLASVHFLCLKNTNRPFSFLK